MANLLPYRLNCGRELDLANLTREDLDVLRSDQVTEKEAIEIRDLLQGVTTALTEDVPAESDEPQGRTFRGLDD